MESSPEAEANAPQIEQTQDEPYWIATQRLRSAFTIPCELSFN